MPLSDIDWARNDQTVLLAVAPKCAFCIESIPFYQRLSDELIGLPNTRLIVLLPDSLSGAEEFATTLNISAAKIRKVPFKSLGIYGTPTFILVDNKGIVTGLWVGKLNKQQESEVLSGLKQNAQSVTIWKVKELKLARNNISNMILLDIGDRKEFSAGHIPNAKNIPLDELDARALEELSDSKLIVIYSHDEGEWQSKIAAKIIASKGFNKTVILSGGFVSWTNEDLPRAVKEMTKYNSLR